MLLTVMKVTIQCKKEILSKGHCQRRDISPIDKFSRKERREGYHPTSLEQAKEAIIVEEAIATPKKQRTTVPILTEVGTLC